MINLTEEKKIVNEDTLENRCPACRASIKYNPKLKKFKCEYCGSEFTLEEMKQHSDNASTDDKNKPKKEQKVNCRVEKLNSAVHKRNHV